MLQKIIIPTKTINNHSIISNNYPCSKFLIVSFLTVSLSQFCKGPMTFLVFFLSLTWAVICQSAWHIRTWLGSQKEAKYKYVVSFHFRWCNSWLKAYTTIYISILRGGDIQVMPSLSKTRQEKSNKLCRKQNLQDKTNRCLRMQTSTEAICHQRCMADQRWKRCLSVAPLFPDPPHHCHLSSSDPIQ